MIKQVKNVTAVLLILCGAAGAVARVNYTHKLKGRITYMNSGNRPVIHAQVEARDGANADRTDNRGYFTLVFDRKEAGVDVRLRVRKGKLVVVNEKELAVTLKKDQEKEIKLYMCQKTELDSRRLEYYNISIANITKRYREETERLRRENKLSMEAIARLEREKENLVAQAEELADKFARVNFDDISALRREAFEYFKAGDIKKAIDTLKFETLLENIDKAEEEFSRGEDMEKEGRERKEKALEQKRQGIGGLLDKARWCRLDFQFEPAKKCYEAAVKKDPGNYDTIAELASFLYNQNQFIEARPYYEKLLSLAETEAKRAAVLNDMGNLYSDNNQMSEALHAYSEALKIYKQLAEKNPGAFLPYVAATQNNLGILYKSNNQLTEALHAYSEALKIYKQVAEKNPGAFLSDVAMTQNNLGNLYKANNQLTEALPAYSEALKIYKQLSEKNPGAFLQYVATTQNNLGTLYSDNNQLTEALHAYSEAMKIYKQLAEKNPGAFLHYVAGTQNNLGLLYQSNNQLTEALQAHSDALAIRKQLTEKNPGAFLSDLAMTQHNLGILYLSQNQLEKALEILSLAAAIREQLTAMNPRAFEIDLCATMIVLARFVHFQLLLKNKDITHLGKADSLINDAINRLKKYPKVPLATKYLNIAQDFKKKIDAAKEMPEKIPADK
jgi:tetratricopeptide (TPR) repeat protein